VSGTAARRPYRGQSFEPRRELVRVVLRPRHRTGELRADIDVEVAMLMLTGAVMARGKHEPTRPPRLVDRAVDEAACAVSRWDR